MTDTICLYKIQQMKRIKLGYLEKIFEDVDCPNCQPENQSSITCGHYINQEHMDFFNKSFEVRG